VDWDGLKGAEEMTVIIELTNGSSNRYDRVLSVSDAHDLYLLRDLRNDIMVQVFKSEVRRLVVI
jgi:hypothetical protein